MTKSEIVRAIRKADRKHRPAWLVVDLASGASDGFYRNGLEARDQLAFLKEAHPGRPWALVPVYPNLNPGGVSAPRDAHWLRRLGWGSYRDES